VTEPSRYIMWSIGNEIPESSDSSGVRIGNQLAERVKLLIIPALLPKQCQNFLTPGGWKNTKSAFAILDVGGYNYTWNKYEADHKLYPERIMVVTESSRQMLMIPGNL